MPDRDIPALLGLRNTLRPERQPMGALAEAVNLVATNTATLEQRPGYTHVAGFVGTATSFFSPPSGGLYWIAGGRLYHFGASKVVEVIVEGLQDAQVAWASMGPWVHYVGEHDAGSVFGGEWQPLRLPRCPEPTIQIQAGGGTLDSGLYQVTAIYRHVASGLEGGCGPSASFRLDDRGGFWVSVPCPVGYVARVFMSARNDGRPRFAGVVTDGSPLFVDGAWAENAATLPDEQELVRPVPPGVTAMEWHDNRLFVATVEGGVGYVWRSAAGVPHWFRFDPEYLAMPGNGPVRVQGKITALQSSPQGLLIGTEIGAGEQLWLMNSSGALVLLGGYGVPGGRPFAVGQDKEEDKALMGWTQWGAVAFPGGALTHDKHSVAPGRTCHTTIMSRNGVRMLLVTTDGVGTAANAYVG